MSNIITFGDVSQKFLQRAEKIAGNFDVIFALSPQILWEPEVMENIIARMTFCQEALFNVRVVLSECFANVVNHHQHAEGIMVLARRDGETIVLYVWHFPPLPNKVREVLDRSKSGWLPDYMDDSYVGSGIGYPLMVRLAHEVALSDDNCCLEIKLALKPS